MECPNGVPNILCEKKRGGGWEAISPGRKARLKTAKQINLIIQMV
jgi:hypothetical protein